MTAPVHASKHRRFFKPVGLQLVAVAAAFLVVGAVGVIGFNRLRDGMAEVEVAREAGRTAREIASQAQAARPPGRQQTGAEQPGNRGGAAPLDSPVVADAADRLRQANEDAVPLAEAWGFPEAVALAEATGAALPLVNVTGPESASALMTAVDDVSRRAQELEDRLTTESLERSQAVRADASSAAMWLIIAALVAAMGVATTTFLIGRRMHDVLQTVETEHGRLLEATRSLERRNSQFNALYGVIAEVTETLSTRLVVKTAIREVRSLIAADAVALRLLRDGRLVVAGLDADQDGGLRLGPLALGEGLAGRAAKRGTVIRMDPLTANRRVEGEGLDDARSGVVAPLIVAGRTVGTISCWARRENAFDEDDEHALQMIASQVGTAVVAAESREATEREARLDPLTHLPNRRQLREDERQRFGPMLASGEVVAAAMLDLDHFKKLNDTYGHVVADRVLERVAVTLRGSLDEKDRVYRYGGEEFLVLLSGVDAGAATTIVERARSEVQAATFVDDEGQPLQGVTLSGGVAVGPRHATALEELIACADAALYQSKRNGRARVTAYEPGMAVTDAA